MKWMHVTLAFTRMPSGGWNWSTPGMKHSGRPGLALSQIGNVGPEMGYGYIVDCFMVVLLGGVGKISLFCHGRPGHGPDLGVHGHFEFGAWRVFSLDGYAMGMHLIRVMAGEGVYKSHLPDFMVFLDWKTLPWYWYGFDEFWFTVLMITLVPGHVFRIQKHSSVKKKYG